MTFDKDADIIDIRFDQAFKAVFTRDTPQSRGALKGLLSSLIRREIHSLTVTANEPAANSPDDRQIRFDINCVLNNAEPANVEMTLYPRAFEALRMEFHLSRLFTTQKIRGNRRSYRDLKLTYQISIVGRNLFDDEALVHRFAYYDEEHNRRLGGKTSIIVLELGKAEKAAARKTVEGMSGEERWALFLCYSAEKDRRELVNEILEHEEAIAMAGETMVRFSKKQLEWFRNESKLKYELDRREMILDARDEARAQEAEKSRRENREKDLRTMRNLRQLGLPDEQIAFALGLSSEGLKNLESQKED
jgi:predicted transposase/invertase (TIGR01784 family)